jgi:hypothetical protein
MKRMYLALAFFVLTIQFNFNTFSQSNTEVYATGLTNPIGLTIDDSGKLWVGEQGTGNNNSRISIVTTDGMVHPFLVNLPSEIIQGDPIGAEHVQFDIDGKLLIVQGEGGDTLSESILVVDTSGFTPGDPPLTINDIEAVFNIGSYSLSQGGETTNPFRIILGPNNDWYISDAGFNGIIKRDRSTGVLSVFTQVPGVVTTGIAYTGTNFFLGSLTGFPFPIGGANVYNVDLNGTSSVFQDQLTTIIDLAIDPFDNTLLALQYSEFGAGFQDSTGALFKIHDSNVDTLIYGLSYPSGMVFGSSGELYISSYANGQIIKVTGIPVGIKSENEHTLSKYNLYQNYPNPFNPTTTIQFALPNESFAKLEIFNSLGEKVSTLVSENLKAGTYEYEWNAKDLSSGVYFYRLNTRNYSEIKKMILMR